MNDLISRAAAIEWFFRPYSNEESYSNLDVERALKAIPAVDAVPIVRCRDCKHAQMTYGGECKYCDFWQEDDGDALYLDGDFYCAGGERRDDCAAD